VEEKNPTLNYHSPTRPEKPAPQAGPAQIIQNVHKAQILQPILLGVISGFII
jgi:hypothetical protein